MSIFVLAENANGEIVARKPFDNLDRAEEVAEAAWLQYGFHTWVEVDGAISCEFEA